MLDISRKTYERNGIKTILDSDCLLLLNEKRMEEALDHKDLPVTTVKYLSDHRKHIQTKHTTKQNFYLQRISNQSNHGL